MSADQRRAWALPFMGDGHIPPERDRAVETDESGLVAVMKLLLRSWPFIKPQVFGRWFVPGEGFDERVADAVASDGFSFAYAPFLVTALAVAGPLVGLVPASFAFPFSILYGFVAAMVVSTWLASWPRGRVQYWAMLSLVLAAIIANLLATFVIDGFADGFYVGLVTLACLSGWMIQVRSRDGRFEVRLRWHAHIVYFYSIVLVQMFVDIGMGLILADMINQSILQAEPLMPAVAALIGESELARGVSGGLTDADRHQLKWIYVGIFLAFHLTMLQVGLGVHYYRVWILQRINQDLRLALVERWHQLSLSYHAEHRVGDSIYRIYQDSAQVTSVIQRIMDLTTAVIRYASLIFLIAILSPIIGAIIASVLIPALIFGRWAMPRMRTRSLVARAANADITSRIQESFKAIRIIKAYGAEQRTQQQFEEDSIVAFNASYRTRVLAAFATIAMFSISAAFLLGGEFLMAMWATQGAETFATELVGLVGISFVVWNLAAFSWTKERLHQASFEGIRRIMVLWLYAQDTAMGLARVFDILDIQPDVKDQPDAVALTEFNESIRFDSVGFAYEPARPVLDSVSFEATPGSITAIVGPTGSGKSTLMSLLLRLFDPTAGSVSIDGRDIRTFEVESLRKKVGIALQENVLFAMSVRDNIRYVAPDASDSAVDQAVAIACMDDYVAELPDGLDTVLGDRGGKISTGQRQRLSIARAVVRDTPILILDEPTAALDAATEHRVMTNLASWGKNRAIFLITHRISTIRRADKILYLDEGRIVEEGTHEELMRLAEGRYRSFVEAESTMSSVGAIS